MTSNTPAASAPDIRGSLLALPTPAGVMFFDPEMFMAAIPTKLAGRCGVVVGSSIVEVLMPAEMVAQAVAESRGVGIVQFSAAPATAGPKGLVL